MHDQLTSKTSSSTELAAVPVEAKLMSRKEICDRLGIHRVTFKNRIKKLKIKPVATGPHSADLYNENVVEVLRSTTIQVEHRTIRNDSIDGETTKEVFVCFKKGMSPEDVVIELALPTDIVEKLMQKWVQFTGSWNASKAALLRLSEKVDLPTECPERHGDLIVDAILQTIQSLEMQLASTMLTPQEKEKCMHCHTNTAAVCNVCHNKTKQALTKQKIKPLV